MSPDAIPALLTAEQELLAVIEHAHPHDPDLPELEAAHTLVLAVLDAGLERAAAVLAVTERVVDASAASLGHHGVTRTCSHPKGRRTRDRGARHR